MSYKKYSEYVFAQKSLQNPIGVLIAKICLTY